MRTLEADMAIRMWQLELQRGEVDSRGPTLAMISNFGKQSSFYPTFTFDVHKKCFFGAVFSGI